MATRRKTYAGQSELFSADAMTKLPVSTWSAPSEIPDLPRNGRVSFDLETRDPHLSDMGPGCRRGDGYVCGWAVGVPGGPKWYLPVRHEGGGNLDAGIVARELKRWASEFEGELITFSGMYDLDWAATEGVEFRESYVKLSDAQIAAALVDENRLSYGLDELGMDYLGEGKDEALLRAAAQALGVHHKNDMHRLPARYVGPYGEQDADLPPRLLDVLLKEMAAQEVPESLFRMECDLMWTLLAMRRRGVRVDVAGAKKAADVLAVQIEKAVSELAGAAGIQAKDFSVYSARDLGRLFDRQGIEYPRTPATNQPSFKKEWLEEHSHPVANAVRAARKLLTTKDTFLGNIAEHNIRGRIHCEFHHTRSDDGGARTGRFSSSNPSLQNQPARDEELAPLVRGCFIPEPGEIWIQADQSQIEYRLLAHYAVGGGAEEARRAYNEDPLTDFHKMCAGMAGMDPEDKFIRKRVKNINFGKVYGAGAKKTSLTIGCSLAEAETFIAKYDSDLPFVKKTYERVDRAAADRGYIKTILGRRRRFELWEPKDNKKGGKGEMPLRKELAQQRWGGKKLKRAYTYRALNALLQGGAADVMKKTMLDVWRSGLCAPDAFGAPLLTVHDELDFSGPGGERGAKLRKELQYIMENAVKARIPILIEVETGADWGHVKK